MTICAYCSAAVPPGASFCPMCGASFQQSNPGRRQDTSQRKIQPQQIGYGCAGLVALFFIGIWTLGALSGKEIVDSLLRLLEILISWPMLFLVVIILIRHQIPQLVSGLLERITKAPGGGEFLREIKEDVKVVHSDMKTLETRVGRIDERLIETHSLANLQRLNFSVEELKKMLSELGYYNGTLDNSFSKDISEALVKFQSANNILADGIFGTMTYKKLQEAMQNHSSGMKS